MTDPNIDLRSDISKTIRNEDGSTTHIERYTIYPPTKGEKITTGVIAVLGVTVAFAPLCFEIIREKREARKQAREAEKAKALLDPKQ